MLTSKTPAPPKSSPMVSRSGGRGSRTVDANSKIMGGINSPSTSHPMTPQQRCAGQRLQTIAPVSDVQPASMVSPFPRASRWKWGNQDKHINNTHNQKHKSQYHLHPHIQHFHNHHTKKVKNNAEWEDVHLGVDSIFSGMDAAVFQVKKLAELGKQRFEATHNHGDDYNHHNHNHHNHHNHNDHNNHNNYHNKTGALGFIV